MQSNKLKTLAGSSCAIVAIALSSAAALATQAHAQSASDAARGAGKPVNAPLAAPSGLVPTSFADIVQRVAPAVVSIDIEGKAPTRVSDRGPGAGQDDDDGNPDDLPPQLRRFFDQRGRGQRQEPQPLRASGAGFFISRDGYIVTNYHVVDHADTVTVKTNDERELKAKVVGVDPATDLAVVKVEGGPFPFVSFEDKAKPRVGDWVIAVGNPFGFGGTATAGIVSALARHDVADGPYVDYVQIDAPLNFGNSGGPSFDLNGRVVGVNSAIFSPSGGSVGIGFDIPADMAQAITRALIDHGKVVRGYLGASLQGVTSEIAESMGWKNKKGALVAQVVPDGPAAKGGLQTGDLVVRIDGREVQSQNDLTRQVAQVSPGNDVRLTVLRNKKLEELVVKSGVRPSEDELARNAQGGTPERRGR